MGKSTTQKKTLSSGLLKSYAGGTMPRYPTAYRTESARAEAGHSRPQPVGGFVAPGFPVEVAPPPTIPPGVVVAGSAAGAAPSATALWGPLAAVAGGLALGLNVREDIVRFERNSRRPFYDGLGPWDRYDESEWRGVGEYYADEDAETRERHSHLIRDFLHFEAGVPLGFYAPDGRHGPVVTHGTIRTWWQYVHSCPSNPASTHWGANMLLACGGRPGWGSMTMFNTAGGATTCGNLLGGGFGVHYTDIQFWCPSNPSSLARRVGGYTRSTGTINRAKECWVARDINMTAPAPGTIVMPETDYGTDVLTMTVPWGLTDTLTATPWADAVAPPGSQPPGDDYIDERTTVVTMPLSVLPIVAVMPSAVQIDVPDQVIEASPDGGVGVGLPPPSGTNPDHPEPTRDKERKHNVRTVGGRVWLAFNFATEVQDTLEAAHEALPKHLRTKGKRGGKVTPWQILEDIYANFDEWDSDQFIENAINNQIEDMVYGTMGRANTAGYRNIYNSTGLTATQRGDDYLNQAGIETSISIPEVSFDGGLWSVEFPTPHRATGGS